MSDKNPKIYESKHYHSIQDVMDLGNIQVMPRAQSKINSALVEDEDATKEKLLHSYKCHVCKRAADTLEISDEFVDKKVFWPCYICGELTCNDHLRGVICTKCIETFDNEEKS